MGETFGSFLRRIRRSKQVTQRELAVKIGVNFTYLSKVENDTPGFRSLSEEKLRKIADVLDADADEVIVRSGKIPTDVKRILVDDFSLVKEIRSKHAQDTTRRKGHGKDK
jgi:transcriptional regulator with XRE-family HTH domain